MLTIGFLDSSDIQRARLIADMFELPIITKKIGLDDLEESIKKVMSIITWRRLVRLELCVFYYHLFTLAKEHEFNSVISADGIDAIFCGYDAYRRGYCQNTDLKYLTKILTQQALDDEREIRKIAELFDIRYLTPFLSKEIIDFADIIPSRYKIRDGNDKTRKHIIREIALDEGIGRSISYRSKSSLQYSSELHKGIEVLAKKAEQRDSGLKQETKSGLEIYLDSLQAN